ncbi:PilZ domain-containing protein [Sphingomonas sp.]|uniref:PilZ domain-containing protein n=1 Tax=Sphingomonas sp. TaxID=28214 RepID=UPI0025CC45FC|nr:PilZ domain-containing protein [Sphingomonas sp.]
MKTQAQETPRASRRQADQPSTLRGTGDSQPQDSWVHDVSSTGMRIECRADLAIGDEITVGLAGAGATRARIVWRRGNEYGCQFDKPLSNDDAAQAFQGSPVVQLHPFARKNPKNAPRTPDVDDRTADMLRLLEDQPAHGRLWMAALAVVLIAVAAPVSIMLARITG